MAIKDKHYVHLADGTNTKYLVGKVKDKTGYPPLFGDVPKKLLDLQERIDQFGYAPAFWAVYSKGGDYATGVHVENLLSALEEIEDAYQYSVCTQSGHTLIKINGRKFPNSIEVDQAYGVSKNASSKEYEKLLSKENVGIPALSYLDFEEANLSSLAAGVEYEAGIWTRRFKVTDTYRAEDQPDIGFFSIRDGPDLENLVGKIKVPRILYNDNVLVPINYGVSSAVHFIAEKHEMMINRAHKLEGTYSISAMDSPDY